MCNGHDDDQQAGSEDSRIHVPPVACAKWVDANARHLGTFSEAPSSVAGILFLKQAESALFLSEAG